MAWSQLGKIAAGSAVAKNKDDESEREEDGSDDGSEVIESNKIEEKLVEYVQVKLIEVPADLKLLRDQYWQLSQANHVHYLRYLLGSLLYAERAESLEELALT